MNLGGKSGPLKHARIPAHDAIDEHAAKPGQQGKNHNSSGSMASKRDQDAEGSHGLQNVKAEPRHSLTSRHLVFLFCRLIRIAACSDIGCHHPFLYPVRRNFRESGPLSHLIRIQRMSAVKVDCVEKVARHADCWVSWKPSIDGSDSS
ncbi:hypothetical protein [Paraburkholderia sp. HP33-1]|uniref:hypothetical protein n=1 Tax=Paraburkholderia sp. HP33-1 TaxID=2883243 RepID=UPI001F237F04|nr:hypothetical protein [Paraburkholderia sp. HP33-1]